MSKHKHNYTQYSNKNENQTTPVETYSFDTAEPRFDESTAYDKTVDVVEETVETVVMPKMVEGKVANCAKLNVRVEPSTNAAVVCILEVNSEISIDSVRSNNEWLYVYTAAGLEGYCMRKFVEARL